MALAQAESEGNLAQFSAEGFKALLRSYYGTHYLLRIWRAHMDTSGRGFITATEFMLVCVLWAFAGRAQPAVAASMHPLTACEGSVA